MEVSQVPSEQLVAAPGGQVFVQRWTPPSVRDATPVVLLHDSLGCVAMWRDFPDALCAKLGRQVVAYDRLGYGRSTTLHDPPSVAFVREEAELLLPALFGALGIDRFALFGHSVGGAMAVLAAAHFGDRCRAVVTESAQAFVEDRTRQGILQAKATFADPKQLARLEKYHGDKARWVLSAWTDTWLSPAFAHWTLKDDLPKMRCPVLAIHGDRDEYGSVRFPEMIRDLAGGPAEMRVIPQCGHVPHREKPETVLELVASFF